MVQTFDFMSKKLQTCSHSKSNFLDYKRTLDTALCKKTLYQCTKPMCTPIRQCRIYTPISLSTQRLSCVHTVSSIYNKPLLTGKIYTPISLSTQRLSCVHTVSSIYNNPLLTGKIILSTHRLFCVHTRLCVSLCQEFFVG